MSDECNLDMSIGFQSGSYCSFCRKKRSSVRGRWGQHATDRHVASPATRFYLPLFFSPTFHSLLTGCQETSRGCRSRVLRDSEGDVRRGRNHQRDVSDTESRDVKSHDRCSHMTDVMWELQALTQGQADHELVFTSVSWPQTESWQTKGQVTPPPGHRTFTSSPRAVKVAPTKRPEPVVPVRAAACNVSDD